MQLNLLIVDENAADTFLACRALRRAGYETRWCRVETSDQLRDALRHGPWDVVLCESGTARLSTDAAAAVLRDHAPDVPVLLFTERLPEEVELILRKTRFHHVLAKNCWKDLPAAIGALLARNLAPRPGERPLARPTLLRP